MYEINLENGVIYFVKEMLDELILPSKLVEFKTIVDSAYFKLAYYRKECMRGCVIHCFFQW